MEKIIYSKFLKLTNIKHTISAFNGSFLHRKSIDPTRAYAFLQLMCILLQCALQNLRNLVYLVVFYLQ